MKLYHKQLNSVEDLKKECLFLKMQIQKNDALNFSVYVDEGRDALKTWKNKSISRLLNWILNGISNEITGIIPTVFSTMFKKEKETTDTETTEDISKKAQYNNLKWQAAELGLELITLLLKRKKKKN